MSVKILTNKIVSLKDFCQDPNLSLKNAENDTIAIFENNEPIIYAITPARLEELLSIETKFQKLHHTNLSESLYNDYLLADIKIPSGKFAMYNAWKPDKDFQKYAAIWGTSIKTPVTAFELANFITYWKAEGKFFHHIQWQQKLAFSVYKNRFLNNKNKNLKNDYQKIIIADDKIPDGFRSD